MDVAITHYEALKSFLDTHLAKEQPNSSRTNAREKLSKLTKQQFQELSTDVYDELTRRLLDSVEVPFLPLREEFHPKRNQARQKLATLPKSRFKDLASDVYYELERRYPKLKDMVVSAVPVNDNSSQNVSTSGQAPKSNTIVPEISTLKQETISVDFHIQKQNTRSENTATSINGESSSPRTSTNNNNFPSISDYGSPVSPRSRTQSSTSSISDFGRRYNGMSTSSISSSDSRSRDTMNSQKGNKSDVVNFASLDSLMADLGDMIDKKQNGANSGRVIDGYSDIDKIRSDYELRVATLQKRIKELETELSAKNGSITNNSRIQELEKQLEEQKELNEKQASRLVQLEQKLEESDQQQQEVETILESFQSLSGKYDELCSEKDQDATRIKDLTTEVNEWKSKYEKIKIELRNLKATSSFFREAPKVDIVKDNSLAPTPDGAIVESKIVAYQVAIDDLLRAGRSDAPANVLIAMKSIVIACKSITEDVDEYEQNRASLMKTEDKDKLHALKSKLSATLTNLMTAAKNHATGYGISPVSLLDAAASHLTASIVDLVKLVKLKRTGGRDANKINPEPPLPFKTPSEPLSPPPPRTNDPEPKDVEDSNGRSGVDIDELKDFLERQTEAIVQAIQTLLAAIRNQSYGNELTDNINTITTIVLNVIAVCRDSFGSSSGAPYRVRGETVLKELENSVDKLDEMRETIMNNSEDFLSNKASKQRLASASFEIAKFTKELVGLID
ncbi:289_t:CDS:10 [Acaulospora morrowiae]|uniref:289_t:CDS:1 n=1 Tax=Acaulospora morrowiae TaxID=94023 RepID=A0A9N9BL76_9GLOM|nr:289_t:CDS:10 [Acaulospora morrowiae]